MTFQDPEGLHMKLKEILQSNNPEWIRAVTVTLKAMHDQFQRDHKREIRIAPFPVFPRSEASHGQRKTQG
jgi:hypothetical protein